MSSILPRKVHLFTPGPTPVPDEVLQAMSAPIMHHRTVPWMEAFDEVLRGLRQVFGTSGDVATFASSGSGAMESAVSNLVRPGDEVVVAHHGRFGQRWVELATRRGAKVHEHATEWGKRPDAAQIAEFIAERKNTRAVFLTHSETSTGAVSDAGELARAIRQSSGDDPLLVLDAISSLGAAPVKMDEWGYDAIVSGSQKALMVPPGMAFAAISERALEIARSNTEASWYFDWARTVDAHRKTPPSTPVTPAITLVLGLQVALRLMLDEGLDNVFARHIRLGRATRAAVSALGLEIFSPQHDSSVALTAVRAPESFDASVVTNAMKEYGVTIAGGQAHLKGKIFRLGHCGWVNELDQVLMIAALERALTENSHSFEVGAGVAAAQQELLGKGATV